VQPQSPRRSVALLALPQSYPGSLYSLYELFGAVGRSWTPITGEPEVAACTFAPRLISSDGAPVRSPAGPLIVVDGSIEDEPRPDILIVTDLQFDPEGDPRSDWPAAGAWARAAADQGTVVCSICSGSLFLASAGLLDGLEATTHWSAAGLMRERFPEVLLKPERILSPAGEGHRIVTAGGAGSWSELALYLIARFAGEEEARRLAKVFVMGDRSDGQLPFAAMARPRQHEDAAIAAAQAWIADNYTSPHAVSRMAETAQLPERTFSRRFRKATGYRPSEYVQALRLEEAKQMLETSDTPIEEVASAVGYADPASFRRLFRRSVGVTAARYRLRRLRLPRA
jgi:transcriptional regulator GlxA family with amidase domain